MRFVPKFIVASTVLISCVASAPAVDGFGWGTSHFDGWPPARFTGDATVTVKYLQPDAINGECGKPPEGYTREGCSNGQRIALPNPCTFPADDKFARLACHELAHRNGWPGDHPK